MLACTFLLIPTLVSGFCLILSRTKSVHLKSNMLILGLIKAVLLDLKSSLIINKAYECKLVIDLRANSFLHKTHVKDSLSLKLGVKHIWLSFWYSVCSSKLLKVNHSDLAIFDYLILIPIWCSSVCVSLFSRINLFILKSIRSFTSDILKTVCVCKNFICSIHPSPFEVRH